MSGPPERVERDRPLSPGQERRRPVTPALIAQPNLGQQEGEDAKLNMANTDSLTNPAASEIRCGGGGERKLIDQNKSTNVIIPPPPPPPPPTCFHPPLFTSDWVKAGAQGFPPMDQSWHCAHLYQPQVSNLHCGSLLFPLIFLSSCLSISIRAGHQGILYKKLPIKAPPYLVLMHSMKRKLQRDGVKQVCTGMEAVTAATNSSFPSVPFHLPSSSVKPSTS
ncbi:unnamed protein product [Lota lota]